MRRLLWRFGKKDEKWTTFGFIRMYFRYKPAACALEIAQKKVEEAGIEINPEAVERIKRGYIDDGQGGGDKQTVDRLISEETRKNGEPSYSGTVTKIMAIRGFEIKINVRDRETQPEFTSKLNEGVLDLPWRPKNYVI